MVPKYLSIVIPAYNEEKRIITTLKKITRYMEAKKIIYNIYIVNDGSKDCTTDRIMKLKNKRIKIINNSKNMGKGFCVKQGMINASSQYALFTDADLSTPITELEKLFCYAPEFDIVIASRRKKDSKIKEKQAPLRIFAGNVFPLIVSLLFKMNINDTQCGFKLFNLKKTKSIFKKQTVYGFCFDVEVLYISTKAKLKIKEVGVDWNNNSETKLNLIMDSCYMFLDLIKIKINELKGIYN